MATSIRPFVKMLTSDFVGEVPARDLRDGDVLMSGVVFNLEKDGDEILFDTPGGLHAHSSDDMVMRVARLTKVAYEDVVLPAYEKSRGR